MENTFFAIHVLEEEQPFKDFVLEINEQPHLIIRNIPTVRMSDSFGNIIHFHDSPAQSFITSCAVKISFSPTAASSSPQDNLELTESEQWVC